MTPHAIRVATACAVLAVSVYAAACGKKGPPLAPFVLIPAPVNTIAASRIGDDVFVTLTVPSANIDASLPVDIATIEVFGYTGRVAPTPARWTELGEIVATIPIATPPVDDDGMPIVPVSVTPGGARPGAAVTILDALTPDELVQGPVAPVDPQFAPLPLPPPVPGATLPSMPPLPTVLQRFYIAIPFSQSGRPGPPGMQAGLVLTRLPDRPSEIRASYTQDGVSLNWEPSGGLLGFLLDSPLAPEPLPFDAVAAPALGPPQPVDASVPPGPTTYSVYRMMAPDPLALAPPGVPEGPPAQVTPPMPLNPVPLTTVSMTDEPAFGRPRCYTVRARRGAVMSESSPPACLTPIDVFPPMAPVGLAAVPSEGGISLIWEPNADLDLAGYLVLRLEAGDATLRQLTDVPIGETRYRDTSVQPGTRYTYSVVAIDTQLPLPNVSAQSAAVEETSR